MQDTLRVLSVSPRLAKCARQTSFPAQELPPSSSRADECHPASTHHYHTYRCRILLWRSQTHSQLLLPTRVPRCFSRNEVYTWRRLARTIVSQSDAQSYAAFKSVSIQATTDGVECDRRNPRFSDATKRMVLAKPRFARRSVQVVAR